MTATSAMQNRVRPLLCWPCAAVALSLLPGLAARAVDTPPGVTGVVALSEQVTVGSIPKAGATPSLAGNQRLIDSERRDVFAVVTVDPTELSLELSLLDGRGEHRASLRPASSWVVLAEDRDLIWVLGQRDRAGFLRRDGKTQYQGLFLYDLQGRQVVAVPAEVTGAIGSVTALPGGDLACLGSRGLQRITTAGTVAWSVPSNAHTLHPRTGGRFLFTESWDRASDRRALEIRGLDGQLVHRMEDSNASHLGVAGVSERGGFIALKRLLGSTPVRWEVSLRAASDLATPVAAAELEGGAAGAAISEDGQLLAVLVNVQEGDGVARKVIGLGADGSRLFEVAAVAEGPADRIVRLRGRAATIQRVQDAVRVEVAP
jgi:hypothetical protein